MEFDSPITRFGLSVAIGLLIGIERGWHERDLPEGMRVAGVRTFGVIGMLGGIWALLAEELGEVLLGFAFLAVAGVIAAFRLRAVSERQDYGATTVFAALLTFALGAIAVRGDMAIAAGSAVVATILLGTKPSLHRFLGEIHREEIHAVLKLLIMTVVMLPVLPNRGFGPWQVLNPFEIWLMIVLVCSISFAGYAGVRLAGPRRGLMFGALAGGLASSTAVAASYARIGRNNPKFAPVLSAGIILASAMSLPRVVLISILIAPSLAKPLLFPFGAAMVTCLIAIAVILRIPAQESTPSEFSLKNPFDFDMALKFGVLLIAIVLLTRALNEWFGEQGIYLAALFSGAADVDAISLTLSRMADKTVPLSLAASGIAIATLSNTIVKTGIVGVLGGSATARYVAPVFALAIISGGAAFYLSLRFFPL